MKRIEAIRDAVYRFFHQDEWLDTNGEAMQRIRAADQQETFARGMDDDRVVRVPTVLDGPPSKALSRVSVR